MLRPGFIAFLLALAAGASPAWAHHRQMPPVAALTTDGDTALPRVASPGRTTLALAIGGPGATSIVTVRPFVDPLVRLVIAPAGNNAAPAIASGGRIVAWDTSEDPLGLALPGRQVVLSNRGSLTPVSLDPTGTSENAAVDGSGLAVVFESTGDLAGTGNSGQRQIFLRDRFGTMRQLSRGTGHSGNAVLSPRRGLVAFESTSHPDTGIDTGIAQIWVGSLEGGVQRLTAGSGPSRNPAFSNDARLIAFESEADLAAGGVATGVPQIYVHDLKTGTSARITDDAAGCTAPAVAKVMHDWRVGFVCDGAPFLYSLRGDRRFAVETAGGTTARIVPELGVHFAAVSTTANLLGSGATPGKRIYLINLYKRPPVAVPSAPAVWFPFRGIPGP